MARGLASAPIGRASIYDLAVLKLLHEHGAIPLQGVAHYLRGRHGRDESHLLQCIRGLEERGLLTRTPIGFNKGRASRLVLELTREGYRKVGIPTTPHPYGRGEHPRTFHIARAMAMLHYLALGCRIVQGAAVYEALRAHAMAVARTNPDRVARAETLKWLEKAAGYAMRMEAVVGRYGGVALVLPVYQARSWRAILDRLTMSRDARGKLVEDDDKRNSVAQICAATPLYFVVLGPEPGELKAAARGVERWAKRYNFDVTTTTLPPWLLQGFPTQAHRPLEKGIC